MSRPNPAHAAAPAIETVTDAPSTAAIGDAVVTQQPSAYHEAVADAVTALHETGVPSQTMLVTDEPDAPLPEGDGNVVTDVAHDAAETPSAITAETTAEEEPSEEDTAGGEEELDLEDDGELITDDLPIVYDNETCNKFVRAIVDLGLDVRDYQGRWYWTGPAVVLRRSDEISDVETLERRIHVELQSDNLGLDIIAYPRSSGAIVIDRRHNEEAA
jgi:hypothetical protein